MLIEEIFGTDIPDRDAEGLGTQVEIVDWLESHLSNRRPNKRAAARLRTLAKAHNSPELAEGNVAARADRSYRARHLSRVKEPECNQLVPAPWAPLASPLPSARRRLPEIVRSAGWKYRMLQCPAIRIKCPRIAPGCPEPRSRKTSSGSFLGLASPRDDHDVLLFEILNKKGFRFSLLASKMGGLYGTVQWIREHRQLSQVALVVRCGHSTTFSIVGRVRPSLLPSCWRRPVRTTAGLVFRTKALGTLAIIILRRPFHSQAVSLTLRTG